MWSFLWSSIRVRMLLVGIYSFLVLVCREWRWNSWTRIHVFHHGLAFSNLIFFTVVLSKSTCIFAFRPSLSHSNSFVILLLHSFFLYSYGCHILVQNCLVSLAPVDSMFSCHLYPNLLVEFPFVVLDCPVLSVLFSLCRYLFNFPSFVSTFWFISSSFIVIFLCVAFLTLHVPASFLCFIIFLSVFPVGFPIVVLIFSSCFLKGYQFSHKLISLPHRLVHLIRLYYLLIYKLVLDSFFQFPSWSVTILCFLVMVR